MAYPIELQAPDCAADPRESNTIQTALETVRRHLDMDVAYFSEFVGEQMIMRYVDAPGFEEIANVGATFPLDAIYCTHILAGDLPELIPDTSLEPFAMELDVTRLVPIGAHMSIPIRLEDGTVYGSFCCLNRAPNASLNQRDLDTLRIFAGLAAGQVRDEIAQRRQREEMTRRIRTVMDERSFSVHYQPIVNFQASRTIGIESLCRFDSDPYRSPDKWFGDAVATGQSLELELTVIAEALTVFGRIPQDWYVAVNASPETVLSGALRDAFNGLPADRIVLEITEHAPVSDYDALIAALKPLRQDGVALAIDDAGAGFSSLKHIIQLQPDMIKLDMSLTRNIGEDPARRALAAALIHFGRETGAVIMAEGIETEAELTTLKALGICRGQGYLLGRPAPIEAVAAGRRPFRAA